VSALDRRGVRVLELGGKIDARRAEPVVIVPVFGAAEVARRCLDSILKHTPTDVPIILADDASPGPDITKLIDALAAREDLAHTVFVLRQPANVGFVKNVNATFAAAAPGDAVVVNSDCIVGPGWLSGLRAAAYSDTNIATSTAFTNHGTILSLTDWNPRLKASPSLEDVDRFARELARVSLRLRPRLPTAIGHCFYARRDALDLVGDFDLAFSPGYGEEVDFSQRCILQGLSHVAADDVFVYHAGGSSFGRTAIQQEHERLLLQRYPYYYRAVREAADSRVGQLRQSLAAAAQVGHRTTVTIDGRCLGPTVTGTQVHVLELTAALSRTGQLDLRVVVPRDIGGWASDALASLTGVEVLLEDQISAETVRTQLVHRPYQIFHLGDLPTLAGLGERLVVTQQDMIAYRNPGYAHSPEEWIELRRLTRLTLAHADSVIFFSEHARQDTLAEGLLDGMRTHVAHLGVDHRAFQTADAPRRPVKLPRAAEDSYLLCLGTNFRHKNRVFALKVLDELQTRHDWQGWLVFAGPHAASGTSEQGEQVFLAEHIDVGDRTVDLEEICESEKAWLLSSAEGVLYPSVYEGFGLVPFEAAEAGVPCFFAWQTALSETLPPSTATIVPWDAAASADQIAEVLGSPESRRSLTLAIRAAGGKLRWDRTAVEVLRAYRTVLAQPPRQLAVALEGIAFPWDLAPTSTETQSRIELPGDANSALLAILARPALRRIFFASLGVFFRLGYFARHRKLPRD
jgi:glycosyltransferase involved in cell wall biosynthesis/GT2 family glycosyltransferase